MAAPAGNQFWKLRSKHGRDKLFATPELLWEAACEYFEWCENNPFQEVEQSRSRGKAIPEITNDGIKEVESGLIEIPRMRPFTIHGLCRYLDCNTQYFKTFKAQCSEEGFNTIITRIEEIIYEQKFSGAAAGFLNPNIIARDLGLIDKQEIAETKIKITRRKPDDRDRD